MEEAFEEEYAPLDKEANNIGVLERDGVELLDDDELDDVVVDIGDEWLPAIYFALIC